MNEKIYELKEYLLSKKYLIIAVIILLLGIVLLITIFNNVKEEGISDRDSLKEIVKEEIVDNVIVEDNEDDEDIEDNEVINPCTVKVDIKGNVLKQGLYEVECNSRVNDVINLAGGLTNKADTSVINLSKKVFDQMVIIIYSKDEVNNFTKTIEEEKKKEEKCENIEIVKNDACFKEEDKFKSTVTITEEENTNDDSNYQENLDIENNKEEEKVETKQEENIKLISINTATKEELMTLSGIGESKALSIIAYREEHGLFKQLEEIKNISGIGDKLFDKIKDFITL